MLERRRHARTRSFAAGTIAHGTAVFGRPRATLDCVVRDDSDGGALLLLDEPRRAPVEMELATRAGLRPARVVWWGEAAIGVSFTPAVSAATPAPSPASERGATVVDLGAVRRRRAVDGATDTDAARLAQRIARFVRPSRRPDPA